VMLRRKQVCMPFWPAFERPRVRGGGGKGDRWREIREYPTQNSITTQNDLEVRRERKGRSQRTNGKKKGGRRANPVDRTLMLSDRTTLKRGGFFEDEGGGTGGRK